MRRYHPKGRQLPALERNVLKYRAFEMTLLLFHIENLKNFVLNSVRATYRDRIPPGAKNIYGKAWAILLHDEVITRTESAEIRALVDYRNAIAHDLQFLTADVSRDTVAEDYSEFGEFKYDHAALKKVKEYRAKIGQRMRASYVIPLSLDEIIFEAAAKTYEREISLLKLKIRRQIATRRNEIAIVNAEIATSAVILRQIEPYHPLNVARNGTLTKRGAQLCYHLFQLGLSTLAVASVMRISYRAIRRRRRAWERSGSPRVPQPSPIADFNAEACLSEVEVDNRRPNSCQKLTPRS